ncbi:MAG: NADPH-dependent 7-cyano-7-deazaguanine reductase QueF [Halioglobus sp.]|nr:NADPH-dependent 7-cyano-7-deazaguanine reductase QueF [Halioglobus sp.]
MTSGGDQGLLLGQHTPIIQEYSPSILYPIPRHSARQNLGLGHVLPFQGVDLWHAYELSWLDISGKPVVRVGRFSVPASSPNIVESKSFKLYLNSLNNSQFSCTEDALRTITTDVSAVAGADISLTLYAVDDSALTGTLLQGECLDACTFDSGRGEPDAMQLEVHRGEIVEEVLYSHLLRSLCPVTGQPDWATVWLHYRGSAIIHRSLLRYIVAYREHREFHEQCLERMFCAISMRSEVEFLHMQAFYTRRGGLDISPFRTTDGNAQALPRLNRQ